jgi:lysine 6-dehydrogenase
MSNFLVLGSGMMGHALVYDLARSPGVTEVTVADIDLQRASQVASVAGSGKTVPRKLDVNDTAEVVALMRKHVCAIGAVSYRYNYSLAKAAIQAGIHYLDLGGNDGVVAQEFTLDAEARSRGCLIVPN